MFHSSLCQERLQTMIGTRTKPRRSLKIILEGNPIFSPENMDRKEKKSSYSSNRSFGLFYFKGPVWMENFFLSLFFQKLLLIFEASFHPKLVRTPFFQTECEAIKMKNSFLINSFSLFLSLSLTLTHTSTHALLQAVSNIKKDFYASSIKDDLLSFKNGIYGSLMIWDFWGLSQVEVFQLQQDGFVVNLLTFHCGRKRGWWSWCWCWCWSCSRCQTHTGTTWSRSSNNFKNQRILRKNRIRSFGAKFCWIFFRLLSSPAN